MESVAAMEVAMVVEREVAAMAAVVMAEVAMAAVMAVGATEAVEMVVEMAVVVMAAVMAVCRRLRPRSSAHQIARRFHDS